MKVEERGGKRWRDDIIRAPRNFKFREVPCDEKTIGRSMASGRKKKKQNERQKKGMVFIKSPIMSQSPKGGNGGEVPKIMVAEIEQQKPRSPIQVHGKATHPY